MTRLQVLFVDDDEMVLKAMRNMLFRDRERWDMTFVCGGPAALVELQAHSFDVLISDLRMPDVDGVALMQHAIASSPRTARVMLSGSDGAAIEAVAPLLHTWVLKPCNKLALHAAIESAIALALAK